MNQSLKYMLLTASALGIATASMAKLPAVSDEAKVKAAEAAAKTAWAGKLDAYNLCLSQNKVVAHYKKVPEAKMAKPPVKGASAPAGACVDPGPFVYAPPAAPSVAASGAAPVLAPAANAASAAAKKP
jgi:hypothetical protein